MMHNTWERDGERVSKNAGTREKGMRNMLEGMQEQVYNDSQTDERNWANLLERIGYNKSSEGQTY